MSERWPELDGLLAALGTVPSRTGSVISTIYGDAILPRGGSLALADLLVLMRRLGASDGVVRTAISRLAADGVLAGQRRGRTSAYALTERSRAEFAAATPLIYGPLDLGTETRLRLAFPMEAGDRARLEQTGYAAVVTGVMAGFEPAPPGMIAVDLEGPLAHEQALAARAWPEDRLNEGFAMLERQVEGLVRTAPVTTLDAMAARTMILHAYRRIALRTPRIPNRLRSGSWAGPRCRARCVELYARLASPSEAWLDGASDGSGPLKQGPDPSERFSDGGR